MRNDIGAGDDTADRGSVADIRSDEIGCTRPAFRSVASDPGDVVAFAEQSGRKAAAEHSAGPGDRDPH
jgi:hypothetical protein